MENNSQWLPFFSKISPPIFVDSRIGASVLKPRPNKIASKSSKPAEENSIMFEPDALMKEYVKKGKAKGQKASEVKIENNLKGLFDYLTAPNIRNKVKSILFFLIRFSDAVKAYMPNHEYQQFASISKKSSILEGIIKRLESGRYDIILALVMHSREREGRILGPVAAQLSKHLPTGMHIKAILDPNDNIQGYTAVQLGSSYTMAYQEIYIVRDLQANSQVAGDDGESAYAPRLTLPVDSIYKIDQHTLESMKASMFTINPLSMIKSVSYDLIHRQDAGDAAIFGMTPLDVWSKLLHANTKQLFTEECLLDKRCEINDGSDDPVGKDGHVNKDGGDDELKNESSKLSSSLEDLFGDYYKDNIVMDQTFSDILGNFDPNSQIN